MFDDQCAYTNTKGYQPYPPYPPHNLGYTTANWTPLGGQEDKLSEKWCSSKCNCCNRFLWFLSLIIFAWPVGFLICWLYVLVLPFTACCRCMRVVSDAMLVALQLPLTCTENMINGTPFF